MNLKTLRERAEALAQTNTQFENLTKQDMMKLLHELQVHQIELELQNEELRQTQERLHKTEQQYRDLFVFAPVAYIIMDAKGVIQDLNLMATQMLSHERSRAIGRPLLLYFDATSRATFTIILSHLISDPTQNKVIIPSQLQQKVLTVFRHGNMTTQHHVIARFEPYWDNNELFCRLTFTNITEQIKMQQQIEESETRLRRALMDSPESIILYLDDGEIFLLNRMWTNITGYNIADIPTFSELSQILYNEQQSLKSDTIDELFASGQRLDRGIHRITNKDNRDVWLSISQSPLGRLPDGRRLVMMVLQDVTNTQKKHLEIVEENHSLHQQIIQSQQYLRSVINNIPEQIAVLDHESNIVMVNKLWIQFAQQNDANDETIKGIGLNYIDICETSGEHELAHTMRQLLSGEIHSHAHEYGFETPSQYLHFKLLMVTIPYNNTRHMLLMHIDLTEQYEAQKYITESLARERELNQLKTRFLTMVSHEFRTPLATMLTSLEMLIRYHDRLSQDRQKQHIHIVERQVYQLTSMIDELSFMNQIQIADFSLQLEPIDLYDVVETIVHDTQLAYDNHVKVEYTSHPRFRVDDPRCPHFDLSLVQKIFRNLISNAIKYSEDDGKIDIDIRYFPDKSEITIRDRGLGIPEEAQSYLFSEMFYRGSNVQSIAGTGIGHMIIIEAIKAHGGEIQFESQLDVGTTFIVNLPRIPQQV